MTTGPRIAAAIVLLTLAGATPAFPEEPLSLHVFGDPWSDTRHTIHSFGAEIDTGDYNYGDPTPAEQAHLEYINRARLDPQAEADRLLGGDLNEGITDTGNLISTEPKPPLALNASLIEAARLHSADMIANDYFAHESQDGRTPWDRMEAAGYVTWFTAAENIAISLSTSPLDEVDTITGFHDGFVIDEGITGRGHRINIFKANLKEVGVGAATGAMHYNGVDWSHTWTLTCDFGSRTDSGIFVLGVVYGDVDTNGWYSAGEGRGGVTLAAVRASDAARALTTTASAGGYGIPLSPGRYTVHATLSDGSAALQMVELSDRNVKIDFELADFSDLPVCGMPGDVDGNGGIDLADAMLALQALAGISHGEPICAESAVGGRERIGLPEVMYVLRAAAGG